MNESKPVSKRIPALDWMRGISCILVVLYHFTTRYREIFPDNFTRVFEVPFGYMAISVFFLLSGYLSLAQHKDNTSLISYGVKRAIRLFPAYWVCLTLTYILTTLFLPTRAVSFPSALINLTMLQSFIGIDCVDGAYWTLACELMFYVIFALVVIVLKQKKHLPIICFAWIALLFGYRFIGGNSLIYSAVGKLIIAHYGQFFISGVCMYFLVYRQRMIDTVFASVTLALCFVYHYIEFLNITYFIFFAIAVALLAVIVILNKRGFVMPKAVESICKPLSFIAAISYPLYLLHQNIGFIIISALDSVGFNNEFVILIPLAAMILCAYLVHRFIEMPCIKLFSKLFRKEKKTQ